MGFRVCLRSRTESHGANDLLPQVFKGSFRWRDTVPGHEEVVDIRSLSYRV